jgi:ribosome-associated translation inhibitor RaiA
MRLHINSSEGKLPPPLLGEVATCLEALNTPQAEIFEARVTLLRQSYGDETRIVLLLGGMTLHVTQVAATPDAAVQAALHAIAAQLQRFRALRRRRPGTRQRGRSHLPPRTCERNMTQRRTD